MTTNQINETVAADLKWLKTVMHEVTALSLQRCDAEFPWLANMPEKRHQIIGDVVRRGLQAYVNWCEDPAGRQSLIAEIFASAPRELSQALSLFQTLQLIQVVVATVEEAVAERSPELKEATLQFSRELAFAAAKVYAKVAEIRGLWDTRLEALIVDSIITGTAVGDVRSRSAALGWKGNGAVAVLAGTIAPQANLEQLRRATRKYGCDVLVGVQGNRLLLVFGQLQQQSLTEASEVFTALTQRVKHHFTADPLILGPTVSSIVHAQHSAKAALAALSVAAAVHDVNYPAAADALLPERAIAGDELARETLLETIYLPLHRANGELLATLRSYLLNGSSLEQTSRDLYVHTNTVRYRLKRISELIECNPAKPRDAFTLRTALVLGDLYRATENG